MSNLISRTKASSHPTPSGGIYVGLVKTVNTDGRVHVTIPKLGHTLGPMRVANSNKRLTAGTQVLCAYINMSNDEMYVIGVINQASVFSPTITSPITGQVLQYDGTNWVNATVELDQGPPGPAGAPLTIIGTLNYQPALGYPGAAYIYSVDGHLYSWNQSTSVWDDNGKIVGDDGPPGTNGDWSTAQAIRSVTSSTDIPSSSDAGKLVNINTSSGAVTITINGSLDLSVGQRIDFAWIGAASSVTFSQSGATVNSTPGLKLRTRYSSASLICIATDTYLLVGDLSA